MIALGCEKISYSIGVKSIIENVTFSIEEHERVGLVGVNGAGKTTLLKIITGEIKDYGGTVYIPKGLSVGILRQNAELDSDNTLLDEMLLSYSYLIKLEEELDALQKRLDKGEAELAERFSKLHEKYIAQGGLEYRTRCTAVLGHLGFDESTWGRSVNSFSGGQKTRTALAKLLTSSPDLLILDEPTNHLDTESLTWLEEHLRSYRGTVLVVSHDRYFLDRVTGKTVEIEHGKSRVYNGNYSAYYAEKKINRETELKHYQTQQREIKRQLEYIEQQKQWNRERNLIAAHSREKAIEKMDIIEKPEDLPENIRLRFAEADASGNDVLILENLTKKFGDRVLFSGLDLVLKRGERLFISGANGTGKSTLIKILNGFEAPSGGYSEFGHRVLCGYYDQENQQLLPHNTVLEELWRVSPAAPVGKIRSRLALFLFKGDDVEKRVGELSGGERARLTLAKLSMTPTNLLILDEPTNHLDIGTREVLEDALKNYGGTVIAVSHDRYFTDVLSTRMLYLREDGGTFLYDGPYREAEEYLEAHLTSGASSTHAVREKPVTAAKNDFLEQKKAAAEKRKNETRLRRAEKEAEALESEIAEIDKKISKTDGSDYVTLTELWAKKEKAENRLLELYEILE